MVVKLEQLPNWNSLTPQEQDSLRELYPDGMCEDGSMSTTQEELARPSKKSEVAALQKEVKDGGLA